MKAYIYIVLLDCDFLLMLPGSTACSSSKAAPCVMVVCPNLGLAEQEQV